jgi:hypothetical protein
MNSQALIAVYKLSFATWFLTCVALNSSIAHSVSDKKDSCDSVLARKWFKDVPRAPSFLIGELKKTDPLASQSRALQAALKRAGKNQTRRAWISSFQVIAALPQNNEQALNFGYNLVHVILKSLSFNPPACSAIYVATKSNSIKDLIALIFEESGVALRSNETREKLESQIEMLAAAIGAPDERLVLHSRFLERTGSFADMVGTGLEFDSIAVINRHTGFVVEFNFF